MSTPVFNLSSLDVNNGFRLDGSNHEESGTSVSNAGGMSTAMVLMMHSLVLNILMNPVT